MDHVPPHRVHRSLSDNIPDIDPFLFINLVSWAERPFVALSPCAEIPPDVDMINVGYSFLNVDARSGLGSGP